MDMLLRGEHIREIRRAMKLTATRFAILFDVGENTVRKWEANLSHPVYETLEELNALAEKYHVNLEAVPINGKAKVKAKAG